MLVWFRVLAILVSSSMRILVISMLFRWFARFFGVILGLRWGFLLCCWFGGFLGGLGW